MGLGTSGACRMAAARGNCTLVESSIATPSIRGVAKRWFAPKSQLLAVLLFIGSLVGANA